MKSKYFLASLVALITLTFAGIASAHAVVSPDHAGIGSFVTFSLGVPSEKPLATTSVRLLIPNGLNEVTPNVKPGWQVTVKKNGTGDNATVTEIDWTGGSIPADERDEFTFSAQVPSQPTTLDWKAYQTYADGSVVSWDGQPGVAETDNSGPFSTTMVINDLTSTNSSAATSSSNKSTSQWALTIGIIALALSVISFARGNHSARQKDETKL